MRARQRLLFSIQAACATAAAVLTVLTALTPTWIEQLFSVSPDGGSGDTEWLQVTSFAVCAVIATALARRTWRAATDD